MIKLTNQTILEFKLTEEGKKYVGDMLLLQRGIFESLLLSNDDYSQPISMTSNITVIDSESIINKVYQSKIQYIDELCKKTNNETIQMMFLDFLCIFAGNINEKYIVDGDITILENIEDN